MINKLINGLKNAVLVFAYAIIIILIVFSFGLGLVFFEWEDGYEGEYQRKRDMWRIRKIKKEKNNVKD